MPNSRSSIVEELPTDDRASADSSAQDPACITVALSPEALLGTKTVWVKLLHATAIPLLVGGAVYWLEGDFSIALFRQAWPMMGLLAAAYLAASALHARFDRFPFINKFEALLVSVSLTLVPAGGLLAGITESPIDTVGLFATGASIGWFLLIHCPHPFRSSQLLVLPGGTANRLLTLPGLSEMEAREWEPSGAGRSASLDGIVADPRAPGANGREILADCSTKGLPVYHAEHIYQLLTARLPVAPPNEARLEVGPHQQTRSLKRAMDLLLVVVSLPITVPLLVVTALAIRIGSRGPILFWQERVGRDGETFQMAKFRSMHVGHEGEDRAVFADENDDRITTVGHFLRRSRLDELPQIWNVLKGEMSLIGPRPEQVGLAETFGDALRLYHARHRVRPGITGWAQVLHGYAADVDETRRKLEHDLYYLKHRSVVLNLLIVYLTFKTLLTGFGAR